MNKTSIEWTDYTWNPVTGCHKVSRGCKHCYAETLTNRFAKTWGVKSFREIILHPERLTEPIKNKKKWAGKKVFVCSMSDLFQEGVPFGFILDVFIAIMATPLYHISNTYQAALEFYQWFEQTFKLVALPFRFSPQNVWIGTSVENQATANERIPYLLQIPAAVRFLSCEPLLGEIDLNNFLPIMEPTTGNDIHWVIAGGESGHGAEPTHPNWVRSLRDQCQAANVPFFFKQWGEWRPGSEIGEDMTCLNPQDKKHFLFDDFTGMYRAGKSKAGNLLDGVQHLNFPL